MMFQSKSAKTMSRLRAAITTSRSAESLRDLPERLSTIIMHFDTLAVHPDFRQDIFNILDTATGVAEALMDETYPADHAIAQVTGVMQVLPRLINHLTHRPTMNGFSILNPANGSIYPQVHSTEGEANASLEHLQRMGAARGCIVVPVKVNSMHAIQPIERRLSPPAIPAFDPDHIPAGIKPEVPVASWEPENQTKDEDFWGPHPKDKIQKEADHVAAGIRMMNKEQEETMRIAQNFPPLISEPSTKPAGGIRGTGTWEGPSERAKAAAAGPELSIPIDVQSESVSLPNSAADSPEKLRPDTPPAGPEALGNGISQPNIDVADEPRPVPPPPSQTVKA